MTIEGVISSRKCWKTSEACSTESELKENSLSIKGADLKRIEEGQKSNKNQSRDKGTLNTERRKYNNRNMQYGSVKHSQPSY